MSTPQKTAKITEIFQYTPPTLQDNKDWCICFYAYDPNRQCMRRKRIKLNHIKKISERRAYANAMIKRLNEQLLKGWNPWIEKENENAYHFFEDVCNKYKKQLEKLHDDKEHRDDTYSTYSSYIRNLVNFNKQRKKPILFIYHFDADFCVDFIDHIYYDRENGVSTRNHYVTWLRAFAKFCIANNYIKYNPALGIGFLGKKKKQKKNRTVIPDLVLENITNYVAEKNKHFQLACYLLHYCLIRPNEMSLLRISNLYPAKQVIYIQGDISKNHEDATITMPAKVIHLMTELKIFNSPSHYYLFSDKFKPGEKQRDSKQFRDFWQHYVRKDLKLPAEYKFYSLKDTAITNMIRQGLDTLTVRDQARHSSILMTDMYTPHDIQKANPLLLNYNGVL